METIMENETEKEIYMTYLMAQGMFEHDAEKMAEDLASRLIYEE